MKKPLYVDINIKRLDDFVSHHTKIQKDLDDGTPVFASVEFSINGACNRRCAFCPRFNENDYPNLYKSLDINVFKNIIIDLKNIEYRGRLSFSGFCEPLLTKNLNHYIEIIKESLPESPIEIVSNGDPLTGKNGKKKLQDLFLSGLSNIRVSLYDGPEQRPYFEKLKKELGLSNDQFILRNRYLKPDKSYRMTISNRAGSVNLSNDVFELKALKTSLKQPCHYPFYKVLIDYDGALLMCSNDWKKERIMGNVHDESIIKIWKNDFFNKTRKSLSNCDRSHSPCNVCDVEGTMNGKTAFDKWNEFFTTKS